MIDPLATRLRAIVANPEKSAVFLDQPCLDFGLTRLRSLFRPRIGIIVGTVDFIGAVNGRVATLFGGNGQPLVIRARCERFVAQARSIHSHYALVTRRDGHLICQRDARPQRRNKCRTRD